MNEQVQAKVAFEVLCELCASIRMWDSQGNELPPSQKLMLLDNPIRRAIRRIASTENCDERFRTDIHMQREDDGESQASDPE